MVRSGWQLLIPAFLVFLVACDSNSGFLGFGDESQGEVTPSPTSSSPVSSSATAVMTTVAAPVTPTDTQVAGGSQTPLATPTEPTTLLVPEALGGFLYPIRGVCLPPSPYVLPNAPRPYRKGIHEGVDLYEGDVCTAVESGTEVLAVYSGVVIRADTNYTDPSREEFAAVAAKIAHAGAGDAVDLDFYRGRQVWISHGKGIVTRYAHLSGIVPDIEVGVAVKGGQLIGFVGESGTPEGALDPGTQNHLHFEVRIEDSFLGAGLEAEEVRFLYESLFSGAR